MAADTADERCDELLCVARVSCGDEGVEFVALKVEPDRRVEAGREGCSDLAGVIERSTASRSPASTALKLSP